MKHRADFDDLFADALELKVMKTIDRFEKASDQIKRDEFAARQSAAASAPRKNITKQQLSEFRDDFARRHKGKDYGWRNAACLEFKISKDTLRKRMGK